MAIYKNVYDIEQGRGLKESSILGKRNFAADTKLSD